MDMQHHGMLNLNPIENLWDHLGRQAAVREPHKLFPRMQSKNALGHSEYRCVLSLLCRVVEILVHNIENMLCLHFFTEDWSTLLNSA